MTQDNSTAAEPAEPQFSIGDMCKDFDVTPRTLRFYEQKELLRPERVGQRRLYSRQDRARLTLILRGRRFGFSLGEIGALLDLYNPEGRNAAQMRATLNAAQDRLEIMRRQHIELGAAITDLAEHITDAERVLTEQQPPSDPPES